jgi:2'-hydroxyisoflavone reductase
MDIGRRDFVRTTLAAASAIGLGFRAGSGLAAPVPARALGLLVLGGTSFLGPYQIRYALERGHTVSMFNRGRTEPRILRDVFGAVEPLIGDRATDLTALEGRDWDAVIDNSGQHSDWARTSARLLRDHADRYLFVSSTGVYYPYRSTNITESYRVPLNDEPVREPPSYSPMKARSELEVERAFGDGAIIVRPQYIVGPGDPTDRFPYWPVRFERGGDVLAPGMRADPVQLIDVRDLAEFMIRLVEDRASGTFNAAGPASPLSMGEFTDVVHAAINPAANPVRVEDYAFLREHGLTYSIPWLMPLDDNVGAARIDISRARAAGLTHRPIADTTRDTLTWWHSDAVSTERRASPRFTPSAELVSSILAAWTTRVRG